MNSPFSPNIPQLPDELEISGRKASYTYRKPGEYRLAIPSGLEYRITMQGAQGGGGGAGYSRGGSRGEGGGRIVPGAPGVAGQIKEFKWRRAGEVLIITIGAGGQGGRGVEGLDGATGADGWMRIEVRKIGPLARLRNLTLLFRNHLSAWFTWTKGDAIATIVTAALTFIMVLLICGS